MKRIDYAVTLTTALLKAPEKATNDILTYFGALFEFHELQKPGMSSLGARSDSGEELSFADWIQLLKSEKVKNWQVLHAAQDPERLPAHIAAAFAGTQEYILEIETERASRCYTIQTAFSPPYSITPTELGELVDGQAIKDQLWVLMADLVNESNEMNGRDTVENGLIRDYLSSSEGIGIFNFLVTNLVEEIQIECIISETPFVIPEHLKTLLYQSGFSLEEADEREYVYLYAEKKVSAEELLALIHAQSFVEKIWKGCEKEFEQYPQPDTPHLPANEYETFISTQSAEQLNNGMLGIVCCIICELCEQAHIRPIIPTHLKECFGPNEKEYKKAQVRSRPSKDKWHLKPNEQSWELYFFELLPVTHSSIVSYDLACAKTEFAKSLLDITAFANKIDSPLVEAFQVATYFLEGKAPLGDFDEEHFQAISKSVEKEGFSERALEVLQNHYFYLEEWHKMGFDNEAIQGLFATSNADVFGGMGSWNDQYIEIEDDQETYERISSDVFDSMKNYFVALVSKQ